LGGKREDEVERNAAYEKAEVNSSKTIFEFPIIAIATESFLF
jgi:hypothetical protein